MLPQHFTVIGDTIFQGAAMYPGTVEGGLRVMKRNQIGEPKPKWTYLPRIPEEWFSRRARKVPKETQRHLVLAAIYDRRG